MKKLCTISFLSLFSVLLIKSFGQETIIQGRIHNWITDTVYLCELPFHSPYSYSMKYAILNDDSSFIFKFPGKEKPFIFFLSPKKKFIDQQIKELLFDNLTENHYYGHCSKFYLNSTPTFLIEPGNSIDIDLTYNVIIEQLTPEKANYLKKVGVDVFEDNTVQDFGEAEIVFFGDDKFQYEYFQKSFMLDDIVDKVLSAPSSQNIDMAISKLMHIKQELLNELEENREKLSAFFYEYIKSEIEFGTRKEFLKYLRFEKEDYLKDIINNKIVPAKFFDILAFNTYTVNEATLLSEEFNEYIENYINFMMSTIKGEYVKYHPFNTDKFSFVSEELPINCLYYYLANHLLMCIPDEENTMIKKKIDEFFPQGELNMKLN